MDILSLNRDETNPKRIAFVVDQLCERVAVPGQAGGASLTVQYNNAGILNGMSGTSWDDANRKLTLNGGSAATTNLFIEGSNGSDPAQGAQIQMTNTAAATGVQNKSIRVNSTGSLEIINSGYNHSLVSITDGSGVTISSGSSAAVNTLFVTDTVAGNTVRIISQNASSANNSIAGIEVTTGVANAFALLDLNNQTAAPILNLGWGSGVTAGLNINNNGASKVQINNGMQVGAPTGGDKGTGTINVSSGVFLNGTAYTNPDYVFEHAFTGKIEKYAERKRAKDYTGRLNLEDLEAHIKATHRLPGITDEPTDIFDRADIALEKIEELTLYILEQDKRIKALESMLLP